MAQHAWNITGPMGNSYNLGLFHGETTKHVVVHCNNSIVVIDFDVQESKTYSLFLDQELCEVTIDHTGDESFTYDCKINREVETPWNQERKKHRAEEDRMEKIRLFAAGTVAMVLALVFLLG